MDEIANVPPSDDTLARSWAGVPAQTFAALSSLRGWYIAAALCAHDRAIRLPDLATRVAAWERDRPPEEVTETQQQRELARLYHVDLPRLADAGVIEPDFTDGSITPAAGPSSFMSAVLGTGVERGSDRCRNWTLVCEILADETRRDVVSVLEERLGDEEPPYEIGREALADAVVSRSCHDGSDDAIPDRRLRVAVALHHIHLPLLDEAGLLDYDPDEGTVAYGPPTELREEWRRLSALGRSPD